ncbi:MAG: hypothetical protein H6835_12470 [Planctomycetes bacterium]|nr:hypothetical protein [Planctomycetota bacterium]
MLRLVAGALCVLALLGQLAAQNSTRKVRRPPGELAAKAGSAVHWRKDVAAALVEAKQKGKPVFWYVPEVKGSPMDRKPEVDRYMMGGPFSWPSTIALLNEHFVPVKEVAEGARAKALGLLRGEFLEPGYVLLDGDGKALLRVDQLTTFHPQWFEAPLRRAVQQPREGWPGGVGLDDAWQQLRRGELQGAQDALRLVSFYSPEEAAEGLWLQGVAGFRSGRRSKATEAWRSITELYAGSAWASKAALELEGHGPFVHGFEVYGELPAAALASGPVDGTRAPDGTYTEAELWQRSVDYLCGMADDDGVYRDSIYDFGGTDGLPNVYAAVTCLVGEALLAAEARAAAGGFALDDRGRARIGEVLLQIRGHAERADWLALEDKDEILWARAYAVRFLLAFGERRGADGREGDDAQAAALRGGVGALLALQPETGVWFHEYGNPFAIATALQALHGARAAGVEVPQDNIDKGLRALAHDRTGDGAFTYGQTAEGRQPRVSVEAASCRMPLCELGLYLFGASDQQRLAAAVEAGRRYHGELAAVRKYDDHAGRLGYGGFFFWFDMLGRAEAIARLDDVERRHRFAGEERELILRLPEFDGCFVDSHELGRCYGTAMALLCLDVLDGALR